MIRAIRKFRPTIVLANATEDRHPDHGRAAQLIRDAAWMSGLRKIETFGDDGQPQAAWRPAQVYHFIQDRFLQPDFVVDITDVIEKKIAAIKCFKTQFLAEKDNEPQTYISSPEFFDSVMYRAKMLGKMIGVPYAEGYTSAKMIGVKSLMDLINVPT